METKNKRTVREFFQEMDKKVKWVILGQAIVVLLCLGVLGGIKIEDSRIKKQKMIESGYGTTIAIVNMDEGAMVGGELVYYSNTFIDGLSANFTVVSAQAAQVGLENGVYGGIVILPPDMSRNIMTISSTNPVSVVLTYEINTDLPESSYINVFESISNLQKAINNSCSYVYISSMMQEIHKAQDNVKQMFENDQSDLEAVNQLRNTNFMKGLTLEAMPEIKDDFIQGDTSLFSSATTKLVDDLHTLYSEWYKTEVKEYEDYIVILKALADDIQSESSAYLVELIEAYEQMDEALNDLEDYKDELDRYKRELDNAYSYLASQIPGFPSTPSVTVPTVTLPDLTLITIPTMSSSLQYNLDNFQSIVDTFSIDDYESYLGERSQNIIEAFELSRDQAIKSYNDAQTANQTMMNNNIDLYREFARDTYSKAMDQYAKDADVLEAALDSFYNSKYSTSQENQKYMTEFESMLSNSRNDSVLNSNFVDFLVSPIEISGNPYRESIDSDAIWRSNVVTAMLIISLVLSLMILILIFLSYKKRRQQTAR